MWLDWKNKAQALFRNLEKKKNYVVAIILKYNTLAGSMSFFCHGGESCHTIVIDVLDWL
jgi:hypothetical protein